MHQESSPGKMGDMTRLLLLLLLVGVAVSSSVDLQKRIIGGQKCGNERQYHVKFVDRKDRFFCGGTLISENWILTAAHCKQRKWNMIPVVGLHPDPSQKQRGKVAHRRGYKSWSKLWFKKHDIMLVELRDAITKIEPVKLPDCKNIPSRGYMVQTAGHGATTLGPFYTRMPGESRTLQCVELKITLDSYKPCGGKYSKKYGETYFKLFKSPGKDIAPGDSGGGVVFDGMIYGVNAFTNSGTHGCVAPAGFVNVCEYQEWIEKTANVTFPPKSG